MEGKIRVAVVGGASYTGGELLRLLSTHPRADVACVTSSSHPGESVSRAHPFLYHSLDMDFMPYDAGQMRASCDVVFLAKPHPSSFSYVKDLFGEGLKIIDLSAGFRFSDPAVFERWYRMKHECPEFLGRAVYGLPELYREKISGSALVANPGCYPTCVVLGLAPLLARGGCGDGCICVSAVSGFSGAGKGRVNESNFAPEVFNNIKPYKIVDHQHTPEIELELSRISGKEARVAFVPHVAGFERGILCTMYLAPDSRVEERELVRIYEEFYSGSDFVRVRAQSGRAEIKDVVYTNFCDIGIRRNDRNGMLIITSAIDNLVKGASGQAIQNMNIMCGFPETEGMLSGKPRRAG